MKRLNLRFLETIYLLAVFSLNYRTFPQVQTTLTRDELLQKFAAPSEKVHANEVSPNSFKSLFSMPRHTAEPTNAVAQDANEVARRFSQRLGVTPFAGRGTEISALPPEVPYGKPDDRAFQENPHAVSLATFPFRIRESWKQIDEPFEQSNPAQFSYLRNLQSKSDVWNAHGAAGFVLEPGFGSLMPTPGSPDYYLNRVSVVPGIVFDRVSGGPKDKQADSLEFHSDLGFDISKNSPGGLQIHRFSISPIYATDFGFKSSQVAGQATYKPVFDGGLLNPRTNGWYSIGVDAQLSLILSLEGGTVLDTGGKTDLVENSKFCRGGGVAKLQLRYPGYEKLQVYSEWKDSEAFTSSTRATRLFTAGLAWKPLDNQNIMLSVEYRKGRIPITAEKVQTVSISLGVQI